MYDRLIFYERYFVLIVSHLSDLRFTSPLGFYEVTCAHCAPQLQSVKEPRKNHNIWVWVLFGSLWGRVRFDSGSCTFFTFGFGSWQNLGSGLVRSCWVRILPISRTHYRMTVDMQENDKHRQTAFGNISS